MDLISREAAIDLIDEYMDKCIELHYLPTGEGIKTLIFALPSAQPERKRGKWINYKDEHCCSVCDWIIIEDCWDEENRYDYCPYCGADMRGDGDE